FGRVTVARRFRDAGELDAPVARRFRLGKVFAISVRRSFATSEVVGERKVARVSISALDLPSFSERQPLPMIATRAKIAEKERKCRVCKAIALRDQSKALHREELQSCEKTAESVCPSAVYSATFLCGSDASDAPHAHVSGRCAL